MSSKTERDSGDAYAYAYGCMSTLLDLYLKGLVSEENARRMFEEIKAELEENLR